MRLMDHVYRGIQALRRITRALGLKPPTVRVLPPNPASKPVDGVAYSPHLTFGSAGHIATKHLHEYVRQHRKGKFLDVGGRGGEFVRFAGPLDYYILDIDPQVGGYNVIQGDICNCPQIPIGSFDVVFSNNTFEHLTEPWLAAAETGRILKPGGLAICLTVFAWRYHPVPQDYWRYTHSALELIFERYGGLETLASGYDLRARRSNMVGGKKFPGDLDRVPVDELGGWRENWVVYYVGRRPGTGGTGKI